MINLHDWDIVENEHLYGPGKRLLIFLQGCSIHCDGCINKHIWSFDGGQPFTPEDMLQLCRNNHVDGITIHGGEPLDQAEDLFHTVVCLKQHGFTVILFTGYQKKELNRVQASIWKQADIVVSGRFVLAKKNVYLQFRGSTNQRVFTHQGKYKNYKVKDGKTVAILTIKENGSLNIRGFYTDDIAEIRKLSTDK